MELLLLQTNVIRGLRYEAVTVGCSPTTIPLPTFPFSFFFLPFEAALWRIEVPRLGVKSELQLPACTPS